MKRSLLIFSGWISLLILAGYQSGHAQEKVTCKAIFIFHGQELSGRMMFKQVNPDTVRFAFFNELGMSFVEGTLSVGGRRSAVSSQKSAVSSQQSAVSNKNKQVDFEVSKIASFLDYKSFKKNLEKGLSELLVNKEIGSFILPAESPDRDIEMVYKRGKRFVLKLTP